MAEWFPNLWSECQFAREGQVGATKIASTSVNQKQYPVPGWNAEISATYHQGLETCRDGDFYHMCTQLTHLACAEDRWILENAWIVVSMTR